VIEFRYIDEEPVQATATDDIKFWLGRNSHRLYRIDVPSKLLRPTDRASQIDFLHRINQALERLEKEPSTASASPNYELVKSGIADQQSGIFEQFTEEPSR